MTKQGVKQKLRESKFAYQFQFYNAQKRVAADHLDYINGNHVNRNKAKRARKLKGKAALPEVDFSTMTHEEVIEYRREMVAKKHEQEDRLLDNVNKILNQVITDEKAT